MKKLKVVICGTVFGRYYIEGLRKLTDCYELAGIFARGSSRSQEYARELGVPLFTSMEDMDHVEIDLACVVIKSSIVGGKGTDIVQYFLERGVNVLQEHPVHYNDYVAHMKTARNNGCMYRLNGFYHNVAPVHKFIETAEKLRSTAEFTYLKAECGIQVLFPLVDIIGRVMGGFRPWKLDILNAETGQEPFAVITGEIKDVPVLILIKNEMDSYKPESNMSVLHRLTLGTSKGTLLLTDTHGAVLWTPSIHEDLKDREKSSDIYHIPVQERVDQNTRYDLGQIVDEMWPDSVRRSLEDYYTIITGSGNLSQEHQHYLFACQMWNDIGKMIGGYHPVKVKTARPVSLSTIMNTENS